MYWRRPVFPLGLLTLKRHDAAPTHPVFLPPSSLTEPIPREEPISDKSGLTRGDSWGNCSRTKY
jgi:hypothetical protein